jgi:hypothetical protein
MKNQILLLFAFLFSLSCTKSTTTPPNFDWNTQLASNKVYNGINNNTIYFYDNYYISKDNKGGPQSTYNYTITNPSTMQVNYKIFDIPQVTNYYDCFIRNDSIYYYTYYNGVRNAVPHLFLTIKK